MPHVEFGGEKQTESIFLIVKSWSFFYKKWFKNNYLNYSRRQSMARAFKSHGQYESEKNQKDSTDLNKNIFYRTFLQSNCTTIV